MSDAAPHPSTARRDWLLHVVVFVVLAALSLYLRWSGLFTDAFHNEDVAGITYNADVLRAGGLPYKDDLEWKAPGSFYMVWGVWEAFGRSLIPVQRFMAFWSVIAAAGIYAGGLLLYGRRVGVLAALIYTVNAPITDSIDANYGAWMIPAYIWATVFAVAALKRGTARWWIATGATLAFAGLLKRQAAVLFPLFALLVVAWPWLRAPEGWKGPENRIRALLAFGGGLALGFAPLLIHGAVHGGLEDVVRHYFFSESGWRYVAKSELTTEDKLLRIGDGFRGFFEYMAAPTVLVILTGLWTLISGESRRLGVRGVLLAGHFALSFVGAGLGLRFFKGYYLQLLPAAVWLAAHPRGPLLGWWPLIRGRAERTWRLWLAVALGVAVVLAALIPAVRHDLSGLESIRKRRAVPRDGESAKIGRVIRENSTPEDSIWVWGRWAWPVYYHADRRAPGKFYKVLGVLTNNLTNTWRRPTKKTEFTLDSPWEEVTAELEAGDPVFIVVSRNEGYRDWKAFKSLLRKEYQRVPGVGGRGMHLYKRKDHPWTKAPPAPKRKPRKARKKPRKPASPRAVRPKPGAPPVAPRAPAVAPKGASAVAPKPAPTATEATPKAAPATPKAQPAPTPAPAAPTPTPATPKAQPAPTPAPAAPTPAEPAR